MSGNTNSNHFAPLIQKVQSAPANQKTQQLLEGIEQQMSQASGNVTANELAGELRSVEQQLVKACQQT